MRSECSKSTIRRDIVLAARPPSMLIASPRSNRNRKSVKRGCTYHQSMNTRVDEGKHPNRSRHVAHTSPHAHHGAGVVVSLQRGAQLALGQDDEGIENLVELAQVEDPAVKGKALVPQAAHICPAGRSITGERKVAGIRQPLAILLTIVDSVAKTAWTMKPSHAVHEAIQTPGSHWVHDTATHDAHHGVEGPCRVNGQEDIMDDDEGME